MHYSHSLESTSNVSSPTKAEQPYELNAHTEPNDTSSESSELEAEDKKREEGHTSPKKLADNNNRDTKECTTNTNNNNSNAPLLNFRQPSGVPVSEKKESGDGGSLSSSPPVSSSNLPTTPRGAEGKPLPTVPRSTTNPGFTRSLTQDLEKAEGKAQSISPTPLSLSTASMHRISEPRPSSIKIGEKVTPKRDTSPEIDRAEKEADPNAKCPTMPPIPLSPRDKERLERDRDHNNDNANSNNSNNGATTHDDLAGGADKTRALLSLFDEPQTADLSPRSQEERLRQKQSSSFKDFEKRLMKRESTKKRKDFQVNSKQRDSENGDGTSEPTTTTTTTNNANTPETAATTNNANANGLSPERGEELQQVADNQEGVTHAS
jgi:hypothetical protein